MEFTQLITVFVCCFALGSCFRHCEKPGEYYGRKLHNRNAVTCPFGGTEQCVSAVYNLCEAPFVTYWIRGKHVSTWCNYIPKYTAIASFTSNGGRSYDGRTGGHAAIFLYCLRNGDIRVADQWCGRRMGERTLTRRCNSNKPSSDCANNFYTVEWRDFDNFI